MGNSIKDFVLTYSDRLNDCYQTTRWPFEAMNTFGSVLIKIIKTVNDDEVKLICFKQLWYLAYEVDQWKVQKEVKDVFNDTYISTNIETQLSQYILQSNTKVELSHFKNQKIPQIVKASIIKGNKQVDELKKELKERKKLDDEMFDW
jgi:hypothetical protein